MQPLDRVSTLGTAYTAAQVIAILNQQRNQERWLFDRLNNGLQLVEDMTKDIQYELNPPRIVHDSFQAVQRTMTLVVRETDAPITQSEFLSSVIRPRYQVLAPDGGWLEWTLGTFVLLPFDKDIYPGWTRNMLMCTDFAQLLTDSTFTTSFGIPATTNYITAITSILATYDGPFTLTANIPVTTLALAAELAWEAGTPRLKAINDLLAAINYFPAWFDEFGIMRSSPLPDYNTVSPTFTFDTTQNQSIVTIPIQERPDISKIYNQVLVLVEDARRPAFSFLYKNQDPSDPIGIVKWHPKTLTIRDSRIVDLGTAQARARSEAQASSRVFGRQIIGTFPWPLSQNRDVYGLIYNTTDEGLHNDIYVETRWEHTCHAGALTSHHMERILRG